MDNVKSITKTVLKAVALGLSVASLVLGYLGTVELTTQVTLLGLAVFALSVAALQNTD